ncbi:hypothetical protein D9M72_391500 [compost metagenome]
MELGRVEGELGGVGAHLRQCAQPGVAEERRVLHALGHHHAGGLLEPLCQRRAGVQQQRLQQFDGRSEVRPVPCGEAAGFPEDFLAVRQVGPIDGKGSDDLGDRVGCEFGIQRRPG